MTGLAAFFDKELRETVHTWRIWVLPGFLLFSALSAPVIVYLMPTLMDQLGAAQQGFSIQVPDPTARAAYQEFLGNLNELVLFALIIAYGGIVSSELRAGTAALALTKPLSRTAFVLDKWLSQLLLIGAATAVATACCVAVTSVLLGAGPVAAVAGAVCLWLPYAALFLSVMTLLSAVFGHPAAAAGGGIGVYAALAILGQFELTSRLTPAGLPVAAQALLAGDPVRWLVPLVSAVGAAGLCLTVAVWRFARREI